MLDATITQILLGAVVVILLGWDVYVAFYNKEDNAKDTISGIVLRGAFKYPLLPFAFGVLMGHFFWPQCV